ncbi:mitochondrial basic amino acids transporter isoform X2 [Solenopsis invicta]|uniref:mitochondrial basic amino acids transporter isoform X2 n=1 Tax=Solenopsis invicta TaxID=13686 RepID=UPI00193E7CDA|nr:mitochondrial basic amino acids transporter isoform X2 [Solenopsis invicta]
MACSLDFFAGCLGGCAGIMVGYPLDTVKVHMQTQDCRNPKYRGTWDCLRTIFAKESVSGLYKGMTSPIAGVAVVNAIVFGVYGYTQRNLSDPDRMSSYFLAGASAGIAQTPVSSPIELAKTRLQLQSTGQGNVQGPMQCLRNVYRQEGYRGVFKGLGITFLREGPSYGVYFVTYEMLTKTSSKQPISTLHMLLAGGFAGTASWVISYPIDVIKSRIQAESSNRYSGALDCLRKSVRAEGYSCLYRGLNSTILRAFPTNAATFAVVTWTIRLLGEQPNEAPKAEDVVSRTTIQTKNRTATGYESFFSPF